MYYIILTDIVNIFDEEGNQLVANGIVNSLNSVGSGSGSGSGGGMPMTLSFTCITVSGHENAMWNNLTNVGAVNVSYDSGTTYMTGVEVSVGSQNFTVVLSCSSADSQQSANLTITSGVYV